MNLLPHDPREGCGISYVFGLPDGTDTDPDGRVIPAHPFTAACDMHDKAYVKGGSILDWTKANYVFFKNCFSASNTLGLKCESVFFYGIVQTLGILWWPGKRGEPGQPEIDENTTNSNKT